MIIESGEPLHRASGRLCSGPARTTKITARLWWLLKRITVSSSLYVVAIPVPTCTISRRLVCEDVLTGPCGLESPFCEANRDVMSCDYGSDEVYCG